MPIKIFRGGDIEALENEINEWLASLGGSNEVKHIHTVIAKPDDQLPRLFITIHYVNPLEPN